MTVPKIWLPSKFYSPRLSTVRYIVVHRTEGTDSRSWLTETGGVSAHYLVRGNNVFQLVREDMDAWHAGIIIGTPTTPLYTGKWENIIVNGIILGGGWTVNPNDESIGIEVEGYSAQPLTPVELGTTVDLIQDIRLRYNVPLVGHFELSPGNRSDPGQANLESLKQALEEDDMFTADDRALLKRVKDLLEAEEPKVWTARQQRGLDVETGKPFNASTPPVDPRIKQ